jgi:hypothetical protein
MALTDKSPRDVDSKSVRKGQNGQAARSGMTRAQDRSMARRRDPEPSRTYSASRFSVGGIRSGVLHGTFIKIVLGILIVIFALGLYYNGPLNMGGDNGPAGTAGLPDTVAQVGSVPISRAKYVSAIDQSERMASMMQSGETPDEPIRTRQTAMDQLIQQAALADAAKAQGITVSDDEINKKIDSNINDDITSRKASGEADFRRGIESQYGSEDKYRAKMHDEWNTPEQREEIRQQLMVDKLQKKVEAEHKVTEDDYKKSETKLDLYQIVVRPKVVMPNAKDADAQQKKNSDDARAKAEKLLADLKQNPTPANFMAVAKKESDDFQTKTKGGALGWKKPMDLPLSPSVRDAVMKSDPSVKFVGPVQDENTKDFYIFLINGRQLDLPKDYTKKGKKEEYIKQLQDRINGEAWAQFQQDAKKKAATEIYDPIVDAYRLQTEKIYAAPPGEQKKLRQEAIDKYKSALDTANGSLKAAIYYQMADLYRDLDNKQARMDALQHAATEAPKSVEIHLQLARALREAGQKDKALAQVDEASKDISTAPPSPEMGGYDPAAMQHQQVVSEYKALGRNDLADKESKKIRKPATPGGMGAMGGLGGLGGLGNNIKITPSK